MMDLAGHIEEQAKSVDRNPTEPQKHAGNYKKGHIKVHGLDISIENPRGSWRTGGPEGKKWRARLPAHYGYIRKTEGGDGDHVDVFLGPHLKAPNVFVIDQHHLNDNGWDEHKCMVGFGSKKQAVEAYKQAFSDGRGRDRIGHVEAMTIDEFKKWLAHGDTTAPVKHNHRNFASGGAVNDKERAEKVLPADHQLGMKVPKGGSMCANCRFLSSPTTCGNTGFIKWNGGTRLPAPSHEYCCDLYEHGRKRADGGSVTNDDVDWSKMNQPTGDLTEAQYTPSQRIGNAAQDTMIALGAKPDVASHLATGLGGVLGATPLGIPVSAADAVYANATGDKLGAAQAMAGMIPGIRPEAKAIGEGARMINWDRSTLSHGNLPIYGDKTVVEVPTDALDRAFKKTDPSSYIDKPKQEVVDYAASGAPMSLPEVDATNGRIGFTNGRNRFAVARDNGESTIPVATETPNELRALLAKHVEKRASGGAVQHMTDGGTPNPFDEFDSAPAAPANAGGNPFDEFDAKQQPDVGSMTSLIRGAKQGVTFGFADELAGMQAAGPEWMDYVPLVGPAARPLVGGARLARQYFMGDDPEATAQYEKARDEARAEDELAKQQHPYLHMAGELAGSIPAMAVLPGGEVAEGANLATKAIKGAQVGAEYGGLSGLGEGKDTGERALGAAQGIVGGIIGGAAAPLAGAAVSSVADRAISPVLGAVRGAINPEAEASRRLAAALQKDQDLIASGQANGMSPQQWIAARQAGEPVTLADLGSSNTQALLRSSANTSPEGRAILEKALNDRFAGQTERVGEEVRGLVAGGANAGKTSEQLVEDYNRARAPAYKQAFQQGDKEIVSPTIERLMGSPMFENAMKSAVTTGKDRAVTEGYGAFNPGVTVENGMIKFTKTNPNGVPQYPNLQYWDSVKKELDSVANVAKRQGDNERYAVASNMAKTLRNELDQQVPSYANARGVAAQFFGENNALEAGQKLAGKKVDPAQITAIISKMKPDEKKLFQEGYASDWANRVIGNISDTRDITKAMFNSPNERARALAVFGPAGMQKMEARMALETIMDGARKAMGNSTTARQLIEAGLAGGALEGYMSGWDPTKMAEGAAGAAGARKFLGSEMASGARQLVGKVDSRTARLVAELLTSNDPNKLAQGMRMAQKNQRIFDGLKNIANRVALGGQQQVTRPMRVYIHPMQGPTPGYSDQEQQQSPGVVH